MDEARLLEHALHFFTGGDLAFKVALELMARVFPVADEGFQVVRGHGSLKLCLS
jgi:hypothetical protein